MVEIELKRVHGILTFLPFGIICIGLISGEPVGMLCIDSFLRTLTEDSCKLLRKKGITDYILTSKDKDLQRILLSGPRQCKT